MEIEQDDYIVPEGYAEIDKEWYLSKTIEKTTHKGHTTYKVWLDHIMTELNDFTVAPFDTTGTATDLLTTLLAGTGWSLRNTDVSGSKRVHSKKRITVLAALNLAAVEWSGELYFYFGKYAGSRAVDLLDQIGNVTKNMIRYDKNATHIMRREDTTRLVTRLWGYGADDITIGSVNNTDATRGEDYLDSAAIGDYKNVKEYTIYTNIPDKDDLQTYMQGYLDLYDSTIFSYVIQAADLSVLPDHSSEKIRLGDTQRVYNADMNINVDVRAKKIIKDLNNPNNLYIELNNVVEDLAKDLQTMLFKLEATNPYVNDGRTSDMRDVIFPKNVATGQPISFAIYVGGVLSAGAYQGPVLHVHTACIAREIWAYCKYQPTVSNVSVVVNKTGTPIGSVEVAPNSGAPGELGARGKAFINVAMNVDDLLNIDIVAADGVAQGLTVLVVCR